MNRHRCLFLLTYYGGLSAVEAKRLVSSVESKVRVDDRSAAFEILVIENAPKAPPPEPPARQQMTLW
jgi:hypothetical protein